MGLLDNILKPKEDNSSNLREEIESLKASNTALQEQMMLEKAIKISTTKVESFKFQEFNDRYLINQLYSSDIRPSGISNETLRTLSFKSTLLTSIIQRRKAQVECFGFRQRTMYDLGWKIVPKDINKEITPSVSRDIEKLSEAVNNLAFLGYDPLRGSFKDFIGLL